jgi:predicted nucleic acid-binding protein
LALILDSGDLLVASDPDQNDHAAFADALASHRGPLVISSFVVAELDYMIARNYGDGARLAFLDEVDRGAYRLEAFGSADFSRAREVMGAYPHLAGFGIADASNVVLAERYGTTDILTTDQRDFRQIELPGDRHFRILPYDL